ncbi:MAG: lysophospholipid acyltransferase family protein [Bacillota bacterium]
MLYFLGKFISGLWISFFHGFRVIGRENIPKSGGAVVVANHLSNWDPFVFGCAIPRKVHFMAKKELFRFKPLGALLRAWGAFPVNRGGSDRAALETAMQHLQAGQLLGIFIEGGRNRTGGENMLPPQPGAAMLAVKAGVPIIPVALIGTDAIGYRPFRRVAAVIGGPIRPQEGGKSHKELYQELGVEITRVIGELKKSLPER